MKQSRIVNVRYQVDGLRFDAAIDCDWEMHAYDESIISDSLTPIELYCFDNPDWDIRMVYQDANIARTSKDVNQQQVPHPRYDITRYTAADFDHIIQETKKWISEMKEYDNGTDE